MKSLLLLLALSANAATINFASDLMAEFNSRGPNVAASVDPSWEPNSATSIWVTCAGCYDTPATSLDAPTATFSEMIFLPPGTWAGSVTVWADDTATVLLDGVVIIPPNPTEIEHCALPPGCMPGQESTAQLALLGGMHVFEEQAYQIVDNTPFAVRYQAFLTDDLSRGGGSDVPEPQALVLVGGGLVLMRIARRR